MKSILKLITVVLFAFSFYSCKESISKELSELPTPVEDLMKKYPKIIPINYTNLYTNPSRTKSVLLEGTDMFNYFGVSTIQISNSGLNFNVNYIPKSGGGVSTWFTGTFDESNFTKATDSNVNYSTNYKGLYCNCKPVGNYQMKVKIIDYNTYAILYVDGLITYADASTDLVKLTATCSK